jgi:O-antigen/teichoic acid export membrane protein
MSAKVKLPTVSIFLMAVFVFGGSIMLVLPWPPGPANLDWGVWIVVYGGYIYLLVASIYYVKKGR